MRIRIQSWKFNLWLTPFQVRMMTYEGRASAMNIYGNGSSMRDLHIHEVALLWLLKRSVYKSYSWNFYIFVYYSQSHSKIQSRPISPPNNASFEPFILFLVPQPQCRVKARPTTCWLGMTHWLNIEDTTFLLDPGGFIVTIIPIPTSSKTNISRKNTESSWPTFHSRP
jgi:hypothetical protein